MISHLFRGLAKFGYVYSIGNFKLEFLLQISQNLQFRLIAISWRCNDGLGDNVPCRRQSAPVA